MHTRGIGNNNRFFIAGQWRVQYCNFPFHGAQSICPRIWKFVIIDATVQRVNLFARGRDSHRVCNQPPFWTINTQLHEHVLLFISFGFLYPARQSRWCSKGPESRWISMTHYFCGPCRFRLCLVDWCTFRIHIVRDLISVIHYLEYCFSKHLKEIFIFLFCVLIFRMGRIPLRVYSNPMWSALCTLIKIASVALHMELFY